MSGTKLTNLGRRSRLPVKKRKVTTNSRGIENFADYWTEAEESVSSSNETAHEKETTTTVPCTKNTNIESRKLNNKRLKLGRRTGLPVAKKDIRVDEKGLENFEDYWTDSEQSEDQSSGFASLASTPVSAAKNSLSKTDVSCTNSINPESDLSSPRWQNKDRAENQKCENECQVARTLALRDKNKDEADGQKSVAQSSALRDQAEGQKSVEFKVPKASALRDESRDEAEGQKSGEYEVIETSLRDQSRDKAEGQKSGEHEVVQTSAVQKESAISDIPLDRSNDSFHIESKRISIEIGRHGGIERTTQNQKHKLWRKSNRASIFSNEIATMKESGDYEVTQISGVAKDSVISNSLSKNSFGRSSNSFHSESRSTSNEIGCPGSIERSTKSRKFKVQRKSTRAEISRNEDLQTEDPCQINKIALQSEPRRSISGFENLKHVQYSGGMVIISKTKNNFLKAFSGIETKSTSTDDAGNPSVQTEQNVEDITQEIDSTAFVQKKKNERQNTEKSKQVHNHPNKQNTNKRTPKLSAKQKFLDISKGDLQSTTIHSSKSDAFPLRRSTRKRIKPLKHWACERQFLSWSPRGTINVEICKGNAIPVVVPYANNRSYAKAKNKSISVERKIKVDGVERKISAFRRLNLLEWCSPESGYSLIKTFASDMISFGFIRIKPGESKSEQYSPTDNIHYVVISGRVEVAINSHKCVLGRHDSFAVPSGNVCSMTNLNTRATALLSYTTFKVALFD